MEVSMTARHYEISTELKHHIADKLDKLDRYRLRIPEVHVTLLREKHRQVAEVVAHVNRSRVSVSDESDDMYRSVDRALEKLERKLREYKDRNNRTRGGRTTSREQQLPEPD